MTDPLASPNQAQAPTTPKDAEPTTDPNGKQAADNQQQASQEANDDATRDWKKSFQGLQRKHQEQHDKLTGIEQSLADIQKSLAPTTPEGDGEQQQQEDLTLEQRLEQLSGHVTGLNDRLEEEQTLRQHREHESRKLKMMSENPALMPFADMIPTLEDEALQQEAISGFSERLQSYTDTQKKPAPNTPPATKTPSQAQAKDPQVALKQAQDNWNAAVIGGKPQAEIDTARDEFLRLSDETNYLEAQWTRPTKNL